MPTSYTREEFVSWAELHAKCDELSRRLLACAPPDGGWRGIVAITRGGMVPAAILARELEVRAIDTLSIVIYSHQTQGDLKVVKTVGFHGDGEGWLVVEDIVDTGKTMRLVRSMLPAAHVASVYVKPAGVELADTFIREIDQDVWVYFPWDLDPQSLGFRKPLIDRERAAPRRQSSSRGGA